MADFCLACARDNGDPTDLAGLGDRANALCEGCGPIVVDATGACLSAGCLAAGKSGHGGLPINVVPIGSRKPPPKKSTTAGPLFVAPPPPHREREPWLPRTVAIVVLGLRDDDERGPVGGCLVVRAGDRVGETPVWCPVSGVDVVRSWLEAHEALHPSECDEVPRTRVMGGPEYDRAREVAEVELSAAIAMAFARRVAR